MSKTECYSVEELRDRQKKEIVFITCSSFEERVFTVPQTIDVNHIKKAYVFTTNATDRIRENSSRLKELLGKNSVLKEIKKNNPFSYAQEFSSTIDQIICDGEKKILVDITTFNHEMLLILLQVIEKRNESFDSIEFLYNGAKEYSVGDSDDKKWLSKGCRDIRSVLGYPGFIVPKKPICLIVLVGFEHERASGLINEMEPERIIIGHGKVENESVLSEQHIEPMRYFEKVHNTLFCNRANMSEFDFSVKDVESTVDILEEQIKNTSEYNHIIVPLNTKTSTLAIGLVGLKHAHVQVCYVEPEIYNNDNYSEPGEKIVSYMLK